MTTNQLFFAMATLNIALVGFLKYYIDAKIDPLASAVNELRAYMVNHAERIATLEAKSK